MKVNDEVWSAIENAYAEQDIDVSRAELIADEASANGNKESRSLWDLLSFV